MRYDMKKPCSGCPFLKRGGIVLTKPRIREIGGMMTNSSGGTFPCHKTVDYSAGDGEGRGGGVHCAGALIYAEKQGNVTQMMRIAERLQLYDQTVFTDEVKDSVWDSQAQWLKFSLPGRQKGSTP